MSTESISKSEVRNLKSKKRAHKKDKSKDDQQETNNEINPIDNQLKKVKKQKAKKRKHKDINEPVNNNENLLSERENIEMEETHDNVSSVKPKKAKTSTNPETIDSTKETTGENTKTPKQPSKRQLKREKAEKRENDKKEASRQEAIKKALNYISKWKHARSEWKFEKLRQIWLMDNLLDKSAIPDNVFPTVLEYFEGCKGKAREQLLKKGMEVIRKAEEDEENRDTIVETVEYKRGRELLQALPSET